jgi:ATP-dependent exoDNAse (exonuclease V) alpha subunit
VSSCGYDANASTIHRLLGYRGRKARASAAAAAADTSGSSNGANTAAGAAAADAGGAAGGGDDDLDLGRACEYGKGRKLPASKLLVDECSMMDLPLAAALLNAVS